MKFQNSKKSFSLWMVLLMFMTVSICVSCKKEKVEPTVPVIPVAPSFVGKVGAEVDAYAWSEGWSTLTTYTVAGKTYCVVIKVAGYSAEGNNLYIHEVGEDGSLVREVESFSWSEGWSTAEPFTIGNRNYLWLMKEVGYSSADKNVSVREINSDGTLGGETAAYEWMEGWSNAESFKVGNKTFMLIMRKTGYGSESKNVYIHELDANGAIKTTTASHAWSEGWSVGESFSVGDKTYLWLMKESGFSAADKNVSVREVLPNGTLGVETVAFKWKEGWTSAESITVGEKAFVILMRKSGYSSGGNNVYIHEMGVDGTIISTPASYAWSEGWTTGHPFIVGDNAFLALVKEAGFSGEGKNVIINKLE